MTDNGTKANCDRWMDALASGLDKSDRDFRKHLEVCDICRREWAEFSSVWGSLAMEASEAEVPEDLKDDVMKAIFGPSESDSKPLRAKARRTFPFLWTIVAAACLAFGLAAGIWAEAKVLRGEQSASPAIVKDWDLHSFNEAMPDAKGTVSLIREGDLRRVVVGVSGLKPTQGEEAYQVWLVHDGKRYNCGTFRVDETGNGALVYVIRKPNVSIDSFGITLEPDDRGTQPRGQKIIGTNPIGYKEDKA